MPLDPTRLAIALKAALLAPGSHSQALDNPALDDVCQAIASTVIAEIIANAVVVPLLMTSPPGGGPVAGTGVVT